MFNFLTTYKVPLEGGLKIQRTERLVGASREAIKRMLQENIGECFGGHLVLQNQPRCCCTIIHIRAYATPITS